MVSCGAHRWRGVWSTAVLVAALPLAGRWRCCRCAIVFEPVVWPLRNGYYQGPWLLWAAEMLVGLAILAAMRLSARRPAPPIAG
jgi:hypothetical protein